VWRRAAEWLLAPFLPPEDYTEKKIFNLGHNVLWKKYIQTMI